MSVAFRYALIFGIYFVALSTSDIAAEVARSCESPVNRLEYTGPHCVDPLSRLIPEPKSERFHEVICEIRMAVWKEKKSSAVSIYNVSMDDFQKQLPDPLRAQMSALHQSFDQAFDSNCNGLADYYCRFKVNSAIFSDKSPDSMVGTCAPCNETSMYLKNLFEAGIHNIFPPTTGKVNFTYSVQGQGIEPRMPVKYEEDSIELSLHNDGKTPINSNGEYFFVSLTIVLGTTSGSNFPVTMEMSLSLTNSSNNLCADYRTIISFGFPKKVGISCAMGKTDVWPILSVLQRLAALNITFQRDEKEDKLYLEDWIGHYLTFCKHTAVRAVLKYGEPRNLCGSIYFVNGSRNGREIDAIYYATILRFFNGTELESILNKCTVQVVAIRTKVGKGTYYGGRFTVLACLCQPDMANRECDAKWDQDKLENSTLNKITPNICSDGSLERVKNVTGFFGFCVMTPTKFFDAAVVINTNTSSSCYDLSKRKHYSCKPVNKICECCCYATPDKPCNHDFRDGHYRQVYLNCIRELKFGPYGLKDPNIKRIGREMLLGKEMILPVEDLKDTNYPYDNLMIFFQINLTNLVVQLSGVINPIGHHYGASNTNTSRVMPYSNENRVFCALSNWKVSDLAMGCRCFLTREVLVNCCCQVTFGLEIMKQLSEEWISTMRDWNTTGREHVFGYRERFFISRNATSTSK